MTSQPDLSLNQPQPTPMPAGGVASPPKDPPAASGKPLQGQEETNRPFLPSNEAADPESSRCDENQVLWRAAAMDLGRTTYFRHAAEPLQFEHVEEELAHTWNSRKQSNDQRVSWEQARDMARDAWDQARGALASGDAKPSAR